MSPSYKAVCFLSTLIASCTLPDTFALSLSTDENKVKTEGYDSLVPMILPDGSAFYAYVEPTHIHDYFYADRNMLDVVTPNSFEQQSTKRSSTKKLVEIWNLSPMHLDMLDRGTVESATSRASFQLKSTDRSVGPVENLSQVFALGYEGEVICLKKSRRNECLSEFTISDDGPLVFDCNKDYSAITDYGREPECGGLHKYLPHELSKYYQILNHLQFKYGYRKLTGRNYLVGDPHAIAEDTLPDMWPTDYLGQEHTATTVTDHRYPTGDQIQSDTALEKISMTLKVLSGKPRVFQIESFVSEDEIDHILSAAKEELHEDTIGKQTAYVHRPISSIIDTICSRASDLLQVKERTSSKHFDSIVVERTAATLSDFDTASTHIDSERGVQLISKSVYMRYATLVIFLNEPKSGGELRFPLAVDQDGSIPLTISPKKASAILFYSVLPDRNLDERSIWEFGNVLDGEQWVATLTIAEDMNFY